MLSFLRLHIRKLIFSILTSLIYLLVARPYTYNLVGYVIGFNDYDNSNKKDRDYLLIIHSIVMGLLICLLLFIYNPMNSKIKI